MDREMGSVYTSLSDTTAYLAIKVRMREIYFDSSSVKRGRGGGGFLSPQILINVPNHLDSKRQKDFKINGPLLFRTNCVIELLRKPLSH